MKKKLKILACIFFAMALFMPVVFAESGGTEITRTDDGDEVYFSINLLPNSGVEGVSYQLSYKDQCLEYIGVEKGPLGMASNTILVSNHVEADKMVYIAYASVYDQPKGGTIINVRFKKTAEPATDPTAEIQTQEPIIGIKINDMVNGDGEQIAEKKLYGDSSVAALSGDEKIDNLSDNSAVLTASDETIDPEQTGVDKDAKLEKNFSEESIKETVEIALWKIGIIAAVILVLVIVLIVIIVRGIKKKKQKETAKEVQGE